MAHWSDCAVNNAPALPVGHCNCGNDAPEAGLVVRGLVEAGFTPFNFKTGRYETTEYHRLNFGKLD